MAFRAGNSFNSKVCASEFSNSVEEARTNPVVGFKHSHYSVSSKKGHATIVVEKKTQEDASFWVQTIDESATSPKDFETMRMMFTMKANEMQREIYVKINEECQRQASQFKVVLLSENERTQLEGIDSSTTIAILDNADAGVVGFESTLIKATPQQQKVKVLLKRMDGADGEVTCRVSTSVSHYHGEEHDKAASGIDFIPLQNQMVVFADCQDEATVEVEIPSASFKDEAGAIQDKFDTVSFVLELQPEQAELSNKNYCIVEISPEEKDEKVVAHRARLERFLNQPTELTYAQQFKQATELASENAEEVSAFEGLVQYASAPWKLLFACIPPNSYMNGWMRFACAFAAIGLISFLVLEITTTVGCIFDMRTAVQALVLVAIGTSLPDLTASRRAAESKRTKDADASIATLAGANAASVFIGLGLPWTIATIYHWAKYGESFFVGKIATADITFALVLFLACSVICFMVLALRRLIIGGELGGPSVSRVFSAIVMFFLWGAFITLNIMNSYGYLGARDIFVPAVAINASQHLTSDWTTAPTTTAKSVNGFPGVQASWTLPKSALACRVMFKVADKLGDTTNDSWVPIPQCQCNAALTTAQSCDITFDQLYGDYQLKSCQPVRFTVENYSEASGRGSWSQPSPVSTGDVNLKAGCPSLDLTSSSPFTTVSWTAPDKSCYTGINTANFEGQVRELNSRNNWEKINLNSSFFSTGLNSYTVTGTSVQCGTFEFRMRTNNSLAGCPVNNAWSRTATLKVECGNSPAKSVQMARPVVRVRESDCYVLISW